MKTPVFREHRMVVTRLIKIDKTYQREINLKQVEKIAKDFDASLFGRLEVNERPDGSLHVVDGQHRLIAAMRLGIEEVPCGVLPSNGVVHESKEFVELNKTRRTVGGLDLFRARLAGRDAETIDIDSILKEYNYRLMVDSNKRCTSSVVSFENVYRRYGRESLRYALETFNDAYGSEKIQGFLIVALGRFHNAFHKNSEFDKNRLGQILGVTPISDIKKRTSERSKAGGVNGEGATYVLLLIYNKGLKEQKRLPYDLLG